MAAEAYPSDSFCLPYPSRFNLKNEVALYFQECGCERE